eukprot:TRINITY_DN7876_c0_g5_i1.p1 TRINITY_DN7876_c0_g5~~TRINITY_DN7876_c0_g5_i1.p1  ORF type:complete len:129 (+),score=42.78 TRINITY_DN7876_c0_g5_i1:211-597(+)
MCALAEKSKSENTAFKARMKEIQEKIESMSANKEEKQKKLKEQEQENKEIASRVSKLKEEMNANRENVENKKKLEECTREIEKLTAELMKACPIDKEQSRKLEKSFREKSGEVANLEKCLMHARLTLT